MKVSSWLIAAAVACSGIGCGGKESLRGEPLKESDKITETIHTKIEGGRLKIHGPEGDFDIPFEDRSEAILEWTLQRLSGRKVQRLDLFVKQMNLVTRETVDGRPSEERSNSPLEGQTVEFGRNHSAGAWIKQLREPARVGLTPDPNRPKLANEDTASLDPWSPLDDLFPSEPITTGHEWTKSGADLRELLGSATFVSVEGEARFKVAEFLDFKNLRCARITFQLDAKGICMDPVLGKMDFRLGGKGGMIRSVKHGLNLLIALNGTLDQSVTVPVDKGAAHLQVIGAITLEHSTSLQRSSSKDPADASINLTDSDLQSLHTLGEISEVVSSFQHPAPRAPIISKPGLSPLAPKAASNLKSEGLLLRKILTRGK